MNFGLRGLRDDTRHREAQAPRKAEGRGQLSVLYVINGLGTGGAERSLVELIGPIKKREVHITVVCHRRPREGVESLVAGTSFHPHFLAGSNFRVRVFELRRLIKRLRPQIVHTTIFESNLLGRFAAMGSGIPVLTSLVNTPYVEARFADSNIRPYRLKIAKMLDGMSARHLTDSFHAISETVKDAAVQSLQIDPRRISVIYRGREPGRLGEATALRRRRCRMRLGISPDAEVVVNVGRQEFQKGQRTLLEAMALTLPRRPRLVAILAGREGNATSELLSLHGSLGLGERVRFLGHRNDVPDLLAASDVFVFPSIYEGLGGAALEAMALGLPIVATRIPAFQEILEDGRNALLVRVGDAASLGTAIESLLDNRYLAASFGKRSREIFLERFTLDECVDQMAALYHDLAHGSRMHRS